MVTENDISYKFQRLFVQPPYGVEQSKISCTRDLQIMENSMYCETSLLAINKMLVNKTNIWQLFSLVSKLIGVKKLISWFSLLNLNEV